MVGDGSRGGVAVDVREDLEPEGEGLISREGGDQRGRQYLEA